MALIDSILNPNIPTSGAYRKVHLPWFIYDLKNHILITTEEIPGPQSNSRKIKISEADIPGQNFDPIVVAGNGNEKVSFTIPIIQRNNTVGNTLRMAAFKTLRTMISTTDIFNQAAVNLTGFQSNPKVLYLYGQGFPGVYYVAKCDWIDKEGWMNEMGNPQWSDVSVELWKDHTDPLNTMEEGYLHMAAYLGFAQGGYEVLKKQIFTPMFQ